MSKISWGNSKKKHPKRRRRDDLTTFATLLVLLCLIMCCHPAINAIPKITPIKIPEISPIFAKFSTPTSERKKNNYKGTETIRSVVEQNNTNCNKKRNPRTKLPGKWNWKKEKQKQKVGHWASRVWVKKKGSRFLREGKTELGHSRTVSKGKIIKF